MAILDGAHAILSEQEHSATALTAESDDNPDQLSSEASSDGNESDDDDSDTNTTTTKPVSFFHCCVLSPVSELECLSKSVIFSTM